MTSLKVFNFCISSRMIFTTSKNFNIGESSRNVVLDVNFPNSIDSNIKIVAFSLKIRWNMIIVEIKTTSSLLCEITKLYHCPVSNVPNSFSKILLPSESIAVLRVNWFLVPLLVHRAGTLVPTSQQFSSDLLVNWKMFPQSLFQVWNFTSTFSSNSGPQTGRTSNWFAFSMARGLIPTREVQSLTKELFSVAIATYGIAL